MKARMPVTSEWKSMRRLYRQYFKNCERKNLFWDLSVEDFARITSSKCTYCDRIPAQKSRSYTYNGIDRQDNTKGYSLSNCVPCCKECNFIKRDLRLSIGEMRAIAQALKACRNKK